LIIFDDNAIKADLIPPFLSIKAAIKNSVYKILRRKGIAANKN